MLVHACFRACTPGAPAASWAGRAGWPASAAAAGAGTRVGASRLPHREHTSITLQGATQSRHYISTSSEQPCQHSN